MVKKKKKKKKRILISPWWVLGGTLHSSFRDENGDRFLSMDGWCRWRDDPKAPNLHDLTTTNRNHIRKYA